MLKKRILCGIVAITLLCGNMLMVACDTENDAEDTSDTVAQENTLESSTAPEDNGGNADNGNNGNNVADDKKEEGYSMKTHWLASVAEKLKLLGRAQTLGKVVTCDHTASGFEASLRAEGSVTLQVFPTADTYFTVFVDGQRLNERLFAKGNKQTSLTLAEFDGLGEHSIRVLKQTESQLSLCLLQTLSFAGEFLDAPLNRELYIEFIGDSITCGYGNLCSTSTADAGSAQYQDGTRAYAFLTAEGLNADLSAVSCSGIGIAKGFTTMNLDSFWGASSYFRSAEQTYTVTRTPDLVVINCGTNDHGLGGDTAAFESGAQAMIALVRQKYGKNVPIVWAVNMMYDGYQGHVRNVITALGGESAGLYVCTLNQNNEGGNGHPSAAAHQTAANALIAFIREKNILN